MAILSLASLLPEWSFSVSAAEESEPRPPRLPRPPKRPKQASRTAPPQRTLSSSEKVKAQPSSGEPRDEAFAMEAVEALYYEVVTATPAELLGLEEARYRLLRRADDFRLCPL